MAQANAQNTTDNNEIFLVDGSGYIFRAYYALPQNLTNPHGVPVGAVLGFVNMMTKLLADMHAPFIAVIFDAARQNFRYDIYPEYKANRDETPEDLKPQFGLIREATKAFGIPALEMEGFEADDLIATYTRMAREQGKTVTIVSSDKDLMQLLGDGVRIFDPMKAKFMGPEDAFEKFGVTPDKVVDVQSLAGDPSDNVPGVPGIGIKTAAQLINEYGSLDELLARAGDIKQPKRREALIENAEKARISRRLVQLDDHAPVPVAFEDMRARDLDSPSLAAFLAEHGFKSVISRLGLKHDAPTTPTQTASTQTTAITPIARPSMGAPMADNVYTLINDIKTLQHWAEQARAAGMLAIDTETTNLTPAIADLVGISMAIVPGQAAYIPVGHKGTVDLLGGGDTVIPQLPLSDVVAVLKPLLEDESVLKIGHNIKYDLQMFAGIGINVTPVDDTMLLSYVLDGTEHGHGMDELSTLMLGHETIKYNDVAGTGKNQVTFDKVDIAKALDYAAEDADVTLRLHRILKPRLAPEKMVGVYEDIERAIVPVIAEMEWTGIKVDTTVLKQMSHEFGMKLATLESEIHKLAGHEFNVASPKQLGVVLFDEMGLQGGSKTKTGDWSTAADVLEGLQGTEIIDRVLEWRQLAKLKSTYTDALQNDINPKTGRVHTSFSLAGTNTGRLSSSDPNLQNIPIRTEEGRRIRQAFIADDGHVLLSVDYSQVELRLAAALADVKALKQAFIDNVDIHALTASQVFGVPLDQVTPELRRSAKAVNFGIIYGISGWGLAKQLGCEPGEANEFIRKYLTRFREIQDYMESKKDEARQNGFIKTVYGRKCVINNINAKNGAWRAFAERQAINAPLQGTAADIMKLAMAKMPGALKQAGLSARMLLQVHDELVFEVPEGEIEQTAALVKHVMESVADVGVPLSAEAGWGKNWAAAH
ncbi:DNA polymerase I [Micavibrio aeruginosavorus]|uniref:DNA polymerase I n=1 Tax=Micavibrio aeruginosavorus TaxID=349221 RepID=UPI003F4AE46E